MKNIARILFVLVGVALIVRVSAQQSIESVRQMPNGTVVEVEGVLMDDGSFAPNRYLQDSTAAIMLYLPRNDEEELLELARGSKVKITGEIDEYRSQVELRDVSDWEVVNTDAPLFQPLKLDLSEWNEEHSARYIELPAFRFQFPGLPLQQEDYDIQWGGLRAELDYQGAQTGLTDDRAYTIRGFLQEDYSDFIIRSSDDSLQLSGEAYRNNPRVVELDYRSVRFDWEGYGYRMDSVLLFSGNDTEPLQRAVDVDSPYHSFSFEQLQPSTDYRISIRSDEVSGADQIRFRTTDGLSDIIQFYFNYPVDTTIATEWIPDGTTGFAAEQAVIARIDSAQEQVDFCMYNNNREDIVRALKRAHNRGVQVRYITDDETSNWALENNSIPFEVVDGNIGDGLMHNKFMVIDPDRAEDAWIMTGAMNMTTGQIATDYNHLIFIREQSLALTFEQEFEEMWGGEGPVPIPAESQFGELKSSNTPVHHSLFNENVEVFFAPTDRVSDQIKRTLAAAEESISFALLLLTQNRLGNTLIQSVDEGVLVRGIMENAFGPGSDFSRMKQNGVQVFEDIHSSAIFHHKYAFVDEGTDKARLMTGSYNWSNSAEEMHDENYLVFHHPDIVNVFAQDFRARYCEIVNCMTADAQVEREQISIEAFPNPARNRLNISIPESLRDESIILRWFTAEGRLVHAQVLDQTQDTVEVNVGHWPVGTYWLQLQSPRGTAGRTIIIEDH